MNQKDNELVAAEVTEPEPKGKAMKATPPVTKAKSKVKAKPKAISKVTDTVQKAKAKAKGKSKSKTFAKTKPCNAKDVGDAKDDDDDDDDDDVMKRLLQATVDEEAEDDEAGDLDGEVRDRSKQQKFEMLLAKMQLPAHIVEMCSKAQDEQKHHRKFKTKMVNALFNRDEKGKLSMTQHTPFFAATEKPLRRSNFLIRRRHCQTVFSLVDMFKMMKLLF